MSNSTESTKTFASILVYCLRRRDNQQKKVTGLQQQMAAAMETTDAALVIHEMEWKTIGFMTELHRLEFLKAFAHDMEIVAAIEGVDDEGKFKRAEEIYRWYLSTALAASYEAGSTSSSQMHNISGQLKARAWADELRGDLSYSFWGR